MITPKEVADAVAEHGSINKAAAALGISRFLAQTKFKASQLDIPDLPDPDLPVEQLIARRMEDYEQRQTAERARRLIRIKVKDRLPIGLTFFGDPHVDDDGCDLATLFADAETVRDTPGMYGMNQGDNTNNWVGYLGRLYANQSTTAQQGWKIAEKFIGMVPWLALVMGNHDHWSGNGNPIEWMTRGNHAVSGAHDVKISLDFFNKRSCRVWMRHNFPGQSIWNTLHGLMRAAQMGNDFHIFSAGHLHTAAHHTEFSPELGHFWHALRVSGYKVMDDFADVNGFRKNGKMPAATFIIDPLARTDVGFLQFVPDVQASAEQLTWMRKKAA
jgi:hypothetical protein